MFYCESISERGITLRLDRLTCQDSVKCVWMCEYACCFKPVAQAPWFLWCYPFVYASFGHSPVTLGKARQWAIWNVLGLHFCFVAGFLFVPVCDVSVVTPRHIIPKVPHMDHIINKCSAYSPGTAEWGKNWANCVLSLHSTSTNNYAWSKLPLFACSNLQTRFISLFCACWRSFTWL